MPLVLRARGDAVDVTVSTASDCRSLSDASVDGAKLFPVFCHADWTARSTTSISHREYLPPRRARSAWRRTAIAAPATGARRCGATTRRNNNYATCDCHCCYIRKMHNLCAVDAIHYNQYAQPLNDSDVGAVSVETRCG